MNSKAFPVVPVIANILKVLAVILLIAQVAIAIYEINQVIASWAGSAAQSPFMPPVEPTTGLVNRLLTLVEPFLKLLGSFLSPVLIWGTGEILQMLRRIAINTGADLPATPVAAGSSASEDDKAK